MMELFEAIIHGLTVAAIIILFMQDHQLRKHYKAIRKHYKAIRKHYKAIRKLQDDFENKKD
ncbi:hypothetical protein [Staphylococcus cohnii]|uniref:hypothetical protein n=1 Tax=Staphylococcus cohnii TaxID=29382 RepID=UPI0036C7E224